jgi:hypothetical protein
MRTTLNIDDDVLAAVKRLAAERKTTVGTMISILVRQSLQRPRAISGWLSRNGLPVLPKRGGVVTTELIEKLAEPEFCPVTGRWFV